jgi:AbrB family looped-hinge helix DNA binding protein
MAGLVCLILMSMHMKKVRLPREFRAKVTSKGQVTIPAEVRRALGTEIGEHVIFAICADGSVAVRRPRYPTLDSLVGAAGSLPPGASYEDIDIAAIVEQEIASSYRHKLASGDA